MSPGVKGMRARKRNVSVLFPPGSTMRDVNALDFTRGAQASSRSDLVSVGRTGETSHAVSAPDSASDGKETLPRAQGLARHCSASGTRERSSGPRSPKPDGAMRQDASSLGEEEHDVGVSRNINMSCQGERPG
eukprot:2506721-Rhodomonas_salina.5